MSKTKLFGKILGWMFLASAVIFVLLIVVSLLLFDKAINTTTCDSADEVIEMMEVFVEYDFDSDDYEVVDWFCWGMPDLQKGVTLVVKNKKIWDNFVKRYKTQQKISFRETDDSGATTTIESDKDSYRKLCELNRDIYNREEESFVLNYKDRTIKYYYFKE